VRCTFGSPDAWSDWDRNVSVDHPLASFAEVFSFGATGYVRLLESLYNRVLSRFQRGPRPAAEPPVRESPLEAHAPGLPVRVG
jgi:hypothetical protein